MEVYEKKYYSFGEIVNRSIIFTRYLINKWWLIFLGIILGALVGIFFFYSQKPRYEATCTFIVEEKESSIGGLGSIASQFGFDIGGIGSSSSIFAGDNVLDILRSRKIVQQVLLSHTDDPMTHNTRLVDLYLDFSGLRKKWSKKTELASIHFSNDSFPVNELQDSVLNLVYNSILNKNLATSRVNKKGTIIRVQITSRNNLFCRLMTERLVNEASKMYLNIKTATAQANIDRMQKRSDSLLALLNNKSYIAAVTQPLDINPGIRAAIVPTEIALRDKTVIATLYTEVTKNLEASKLILSQQTPVIQMLDKPGLSLFDNKKSFSLMTVVGGFFGAVFIFLFLVASYFFKKLKVNNI